MAAPVHGLISAPPPAPGRRITRGWYRATGGLELVGHPEWPGAVLWSSFEHHLTADRVIGTVGDFFAPLIEAGGVAWAAVTDPDRRRNIVLQLLAQLPVLWIWDNVEPVTGFPAGTPVTGPPPSKIIWPACCVTWRTRPEDPACLPHFQEALTLDQQIGDRQGEAEGAGSLGNAYLRVPGLRDLDQAEHWFQRSLSLRLDSDRLGRAQCLSSLGGVAIRRFDDGLVAGEAEPILLQYLNAARRHYLQSLDLTPAGDHEARANREHQLGVIYDRAGDTRQALLHYQQSIQHEEERGNIFGAGQTRFNIAHALADDGRVSDALHYARAALHNYQQAGPGAASDAEQARQFIADLEQRDR